MEAIYNLCFELVAILSAAALCVNAILATPPSALVGGEVAGKGPHSHSQGGSGQQFGLTGVKSGGPVVL